MKQEQQEILMGAVVEPNQFLAFKSLYMNMQ